MPASLSLMQVVTDLTADGSHEGHDECICIVPSIPHPSSYTSETEEGSNRVILRANKTFRCSASWSLRISFVGFNIIVLLLQQRDKTDFFTIVL